VPISKSLLACAQHTRPPAPHLPAHTTLQKKKREAEEAGAKPSEEEAPKKKKKVGAPCARPPAWRSVAAEEERAWGLTS